jgi:L-serine dehydratase
MTGTTLSVFDLFKVGIGPSSSHTVGPMKAAHAFVELLRGAGELANVDRVVTQLFGSLGLTGHGHGTVKAVVLGLQGDQPHLVDPRQADQRYQDAVDSNALDLGGDHSVPFDLRADVVMHLKQRLVRSLRRVRRPDPIPGVLLGRRRIRRGRRCRSRVRRRADPS